MWQYNNPVKLYFGEYSVYRLEDILRERNFERVVLFSRKVSRLSESAQQAIQSLSTKIVTVIDDISPEPTTDNITQAVELLRPLSFDAAVAIGGGSVIDTAKAALSAYANGCTIEDLMEKQVPFSASVPLIAVPTTSGTGSEVTRAAALTLRGKKQPVFDDTLYPAVSVIDPVLTYSCPPKVTASCGLDVLSHACESLMHKNSSPMTEMLAKDAIRLCMQALERCCADPGDHEARRKMSEASVKAGLAIAASGCTASHACSYLLSSDYRVSHGEACAFTLDKLVLLCAEHDGRFDGIVGELGLRDGAQLAQWIKDFKRTLNIRTTLEDIGAGAEDRERMIDAGFSSPVLQNHYFTVTRDDVARLFS